MTFPVHFKYDLADKVWYILWNHFYSFLFMFVGSKNFPRSWGHNLVGRKLGIILINIKPTKATDIGPSWTMMIPQYGLAMVLRKSEIVTNSMLWVNGQDSQSVSGNRWIIRPSLDPFPEKCLCILSKLRSYTKSHNRTWNYTKNVIIALWINIIYFNQVLFHEMLTLKNYTCLMVMN